jgi:tetratricopeptide (TPR) repeat protein
MGYLGTWLPTAIGIVAVVTTVRVGAANESAQKVARIAEAITVKISFANQDESQYGSGILLQKQGDVYTVLTAARVLKGKPLDELTLTTSDDRRYRDRTVTDSVKVYAGDVDLAIVKFRSNESYQLAELGDSDRLATGMKLYLAGLLTPANKIPWRYAGISPSIWREITKSVSILKDGRVSGVSTRIFKEGYALAYTNDTLPGMSGGPLLNEAGRVVGIHAQGGKEQVRGAKTECNLGIPIARLADVASDLGVETKVVRTVQSSTRIADDHFLSAYQKTNNRDYRGALADYDRSIALNPSYVSAYSDRAALKYEKFKDTPGALADYNKAISLDPNYAKAYYGRGVLKYEQSEDTPGALADYNKAISLDPNNAKAYIGRGILKHEKLDDPQGALADYDRAVSLNPTHANTYYHRGKLKAEKRDRLLKYRVFDSALIDYDRAINLDPNYVSAYIDRGIQEATEHKNPRGALADYDRAISLDPNNASAYNNRGLLKKDSLNDKQGAIADFRQAAKLYGAQGQTSEMQAAIDRLRTLGASE